MNWKVSAPCWYQKAYFEAREWAKAASWKPPGPELVTYTDPHRQLLREPMLPFPLADLLHPPHTFHQCLVLMSYTTNRCIIMTVPPTVLTPGLNILLIRFLNSLDHATRIMTILEKCFRHRQWNIRLTIIMATGIL